MILDATACTARDSTVVASILEHKLRSGLASGGEPPHVSLQAQSGNINREPRRVMAHPQSFSSRAHDDETL